MAFGSDRSANFVIKAQDAATGPLGKIGGAMGKLKSSAGTAFKAIAAGAVAAATAIAGFATAAVIGAIADEKAAARLNATLRARGLLTEKNSAAIEEAILAGQRLAFTDDDVRTSIETATQFTGKFNKALKIQAVAQDLATAKGIDLASATAIVGKAFAGNGKALKAYGIELQKTVHFTETKIKTESDGQFREIQTNKTRKETIKGMEALNLITAKFGGIADEVAGTTAVKLEAAFIRFNEAIETFGAKLLPLVNEALTFLTEKALPAFESLMEELGPIVGDLVDNFVRPLVDSVGELFAIFDDGEGSINILTIALTPLKLALQAIKFVIDAIVAGMKFIGIGGGGVSANNLNRAAAGAGYTGGSRATGTPMMGGGGAGAGFGSSYLQVNNSIKFGRDATSSVNTQLGRSAKARGSKRTP
jgi:hypothetical protein